MSFCKEKQSEILHSRFYQRLTLNTKKSDIYRCDIKSFVILAYLNDLVSNCRTQVDYFSSKVIFLCTYPYFLSNCCLWPSTSSYYTHEDSTILILHWYRFCLCYPILCYFIIVCRVCVCRCVCV